MIYWKFKYLRTQRALAVGVSEKEVSKKNKTSRVVCVNRSTEIVI